MLMRTKVVVDWELIKQRRLKAAQQSNKRENNSRIQHEYKVGDYVLIILRDEVTRKLEQPAE